MPLRTRLVCGPVERLDRPIGPASHPTSSRRMNSQSALCKLRAQDGSVPSRSYQGKWYSDLPLNCTRNQQVPAVSGTRGKSPGHDRPRPGDLVEERRFADFPDGRFEPSDDPCEPPRFLPLMPCGLPGNGGIRATRSRIASMNERRFGRPLQHPPRVRWRRRRCGARSSHPGGNRWLARS